MLKELLQQRAEVEAQMAVLQETMQAINIDIEHTLAGKLADLRALQAKGFGAVNLVFEGINVTETIPKKVEWDQEKLEKLYFRIVESGDDPKQYIKQKFEVSETLYGKFAPEVQIIFADARTVKPGKPSLKFEEVTNA